MNNNKLTENAIVKLNNIALMIHHNDFKLRHDRLVKRLTGERVMSSLQRQMRLDRIRR